MTTIHSEPRSGSRGKEVSKVDVFFALGIGVAFAIAVYALLDKIFVRRQPRA
jgi:hypothetical protein